jgi:hypothetical protein
MAYSACARRERVTLQQRWDSAQLLTPRVSCLNGAGQPTSAAATARLLTMRSRITCLQTKFTAQLSDLGHDPALGAEGAGLFVDCISFAEQFLQTFARVWH